MEQDRLVLGLTVVFGAMTVTVVLVAVAAVEPVLFVVAVPLGAATGLFWYQSSGRLRRRIARTAAGGSERSGDDFDDSARRAAERNRRRGREQRADRGRRAGPEPADVAQAAAYRRLGLEPGADEAAVRRAYRRKVKEVHPDRGGDEEAFKRVTEAYEMLVE